MSFWWLTGAHRLRLAPASDVDHAIGMYLLIWAIFTAYMTSAASRVSGAVLAVFVLLTVTFLALAWGSSPGPTASPTSAATSGC
jgi:succinate-acetate transporter protein